MQVDSFIFATIDALVQVEEGRSIRNVLRTITEKYSISREEEATVYYLTFEIYRRLNFIDQYIKLSSSSFSIKNLSKEFKAVLRLAVQWIKINNKTKDFVINQLSSAYELYKEGVKDIKITLQEFVERISRLEEETLYVNRDQAAQWSLKYSVPTWIIRKFIEQWSEEFTEKLIASFNRNLPMYVRINTLKASQDEIVSIFEDNGIVYTFDKDLPDLMKISSADTPIPRLEAFKEGKIVIQQKASSIPAYVLEPQPNEKILDMCASPGGKTSQIAALTSNASRITAVDVNPNRVKILKHRLKLLGVKNVKILEKDARTLPKEINGKFDRILLDPPCTSSGTYSSRPEIKWRLKKRDIKIYTKLQIELLEAAGKLIKNGGIIVYSTCSLFKEENHDVIEHFLNNTDGFVLEEAKPMIGVPSKIFDNKTQELFPHLHETEGFFIAKIKKLDK